MHLVFFSCFTLVQIKTYADIKNKIKNIGLLKQYKKRNQKLSKIKRNICPQIINVSDKLHNVLESQIGATNQIFKTNQCI